MPWAGTAAAPLPLSTGQFYQQRPASALPPLAVVALNPTEPIHPAIADLAGPDRLAALAHWAPRPDLRCAALKGRGKWQHLRTWLLRCSAAPAYAVSRAREDVLDRAGCSVRREFGIRRCFEGLECAPKAVVRWVTIQAQGSTLNENLVTRLPCASISLSFALEAALRVADLAGKPKA